MKCPHCKKRVVSNAFESAFMNADAYGDRCFIIQCPLCKKKICVTFERNTKCTDIRKAGEDASLDFSN